MYRTLDQKQIKAQLKDRELHLAPSKHEVVPNACRSNPVCQKLAIGYPEGTQPK